MMNAGCGMKEEPSPWTGRGLLRFRIWGLMLLVGLVALRIGRSSGWLRTGCHPAEPSAVTRTITLPKFSPRKSPIKARGAFSNPSTISSRYLIRPSRTRGPTSARNSGCWLAKSNTMNPRRLAV